MNAVHSDARQHFSNQGSWLDLVAGNEASRSMCIRAGYEELYRFKDETHNGQERIVMVNDSAFLVKKSALLVPHQSTSQSISRQPESFVV